MERIKSGRDISVGALSAGLEREQAEHLAQIVAAAGVGAGR